MREGGEGERSTHHGQEECAQLRVGCPRGDLVLQVCEECVVEFEDDFHARQRQCELFTQLRLHHLGVAFFLNGRAKKMLSQPTRRSVSLEKGGERGGSSSSYFDEDAQIVRILALRVEEFVGHVLALGHHLTCAGRRRERERRECGCV